MVTKISAKSADKYTVLFQKATDALSGKFTEIFPDLDVQDDYQIGSLNEYFAVLQTLVGLPDLSENEKAFYLRLPLDEDVFAINADTRVITVPPNFAKNGVGVQGDESAEVLYFTVDRFFDSMDLANDDMEIRIQWEAKDANGETIRGVSKNFGKDIESEAGKGLMIFGWPISSTLTQASGPIKFAVRFFQYGGDNNTLSYSFSTLPAQVNINASLNYDMTHVENELDDGQNLISRIRSSGIYDASMPIPGSPIITTRLSVYDPDGENDDTRMVDLEENQNSVKLAISAKPADEGIISYIWKKYPYNSTTGDYSNNVGNINENIAAEYVQQKTSISENDQERYYINNNGTYQLIDINDLASKDPDPDEQFKFEFNDESKKILYKLYNILTIDATGENKVAGIYTVDVKASNLINSTTKEMEKGDGIKIPGPHEPIIQTEEAGLHVITGEDDDPTRATLTISAQLANEDSEKANLTYSWFKSDGENPISNGSSDGALTYTVGEDANGSSSLRISGLATENLEAFYKAVVTVTRNKEELTEERTYRITNNPKAPQLGEMSFTGSGEDFRPFESRNIINKTISRDFTIKIKVASPEVPNDSFKCIWMKVNTENDVDSESGVITIRPNVTSLVRLLGPVNASDYDGTDYDHDLNVNHQDWIIDTNKNLLSPNTIDNINDVCRIADSSDQFTYTVSPTEKGYYYCVIINEFNNKKAIAVSPIYSIQ